MVEASSEHVQVVEAPVADTISGEGVESRDVHGMFRLHLIGEQFVAGAAHDAGSVIAGRASMIIMALNAYEKEGPDIRAWRPGL